MKAYAVPFRVGGPIRNPSDFCGRQELLRKITGGMRTLQNFSLVSERRTGKTSLLFYLAHPDSFQQLGLPEEHLPVYFDFQNVANASEALVWEAMADAIVKQAIQKIPSKHQRLIDIIKKAKEDIAEGYFNRGLNQIFTELADFKIHLLLDELEGIVGNSNLDENQFCAKLRGLATSGTRNVSYVITTRISVLEIQYPDDKSHAEKSFTEYSSPLFNMLTSLTLTPFHRDETLDLILDYFIRAELDISLAEKLCNELPLLYDITGYHPFFLQAFCYHLCAVMDFPGWPRGAAWLKALENFKKDVYPHFKYYWEISSEEEQELIRKLANNQPVERSGSVPEKLADRCLLVRTDELRHEWRLFSLVFRDWVNSYLQIPSFRWLHLSDFHMGVERQYSLLPNEKACFFEDLRLLYRECGPWDLVLLTGDLTQRGDMKEFLEIDNILDELWEFFNELGSDPILLAVPGNHDLARPSRNTPSILLLQQWTHQKEWIHKAVISRDFWGNKNSPYRKVVVSAFKNYLTWWKESPRTCKYIVPGILSGDFSFSIEKGNFRLGIVGLNTSFFQLTEEDYKGRLELRARQFHEACGGDGIEWAKQHDACLLLTHHSPEWLNIESRQEVREEIVCHKNFMLHLCGHLHDSESDKSEYTEEQIVGNRLQRTLRGRSLFGMKHVEYRKREGLLGYGAGKIEFDRDSNKGKLTIWPREVRQKGAEIAFVPNDSFSFALGAQHTNSEESDFNPHRLGLRSQEESAVDTDAKNAPGILVFINAVPEDKAQVDKVCRFLKVKNIRYSLPLENSETASAAEIRHDMKNNLLSCDVIILIWDKAPLAWIREQLLFCKRMESKREKNLKLIAVCLNPSTTDKSQLNFMLPNMRMFDCSELQDDGYLQKLIGAI